MVRFLVLLFVFVSVVSAKYTLQEQNAMLDEFLEAVKMPRMQDTSVQPCLGGNDCCTPQNPCGLLEGDCDSNSDCLGTLVCGHHNCRNMEMPDGFLRTLNDDRNSFSSTDDCCTFREGIVEYVSSLEFDS